jgi:hypothetical protein
VNCGRCLTSTSISHIDDRLLELKDLPCLNKTSPITNTPHLNDLDIDLNLPSDNNFAYYTTYDYHNNHDINDVYLTLDHFLHCTVILGACWLIMITLYICYLHCIFLFL